MPNDPAKNGGEDADEGDAKPNGGKKDEKKDPRLIAKSGRLACQRAELTRSTRS